MKRYLGLAIALVIGFSAAAFAQEPGDAVSVDPDVHNLILENEHFRVFDARASRGTKSPMHSHPPRVLISVGKTRLRMTMPDGKSAIVDLNPGQVLWREAVQHSWELLAGELHVIGVEIKSAQKAGAPPAPTAEPTLEPVPTLAPTDKPRRTPPPAPTDSPAPSADVTPSP